MLVSRRSFVQAGLSGAAIAASARLVVSEAHAETSTHYQGTFRRLDEFISQYLRDMDAPGMTLVLADRDGVQRVTTYGWSDMERKQEVEPDALFHIGSISKSFVALALLQLRDEGKLDLDRPVVDYMPWFRIESAYAPITTHHLLTHTSGLPGAGLLDVFPSDPGHRHRATFPPGAHFHYNNMAFQALGYLLWTLDGAELPEVLRKRVLAPVGMTSSEPAITLDTRARVAKNYSAFQNDRPYPRAGRLSESSSIIMTAGAGCIAATAHDMGLYIQMLARRGELSAGRLVSTDSFERFSKPYIDAKELGPTSKYGYGIGVDKLDGNTILRHTGGTVSFMSSLTVDVDAGVGAFASINAQQGYRPVPVTQFATQLMRAERASRPAPSPPPRNNARVVPNAANYAGMFRNRDGVTREFVVHGEGLVLLYKGARVPVERSGADQVVALHPDLDRYPFVFGRRDPKDARSPVVEVGWGGDWFTASAYDGPTQFDYPPGWNAFVGHYRNENPWIGSLHVVLRKGRLMLEGAVPLEPVGEVFYLRDEEYSPEWIRFGEVVNGKCLRLKFSGDDLWRVATA